MSFAWAEYHTFSKAMEKSNAITCDYTWSWWVCNGLFLWRNFLELIFLRIGYIFFLAIFRGYLVLNYTEEILYQEAWKLEGIHFGNKQKVFIISNFVFPVYSLKPDWAWMTNRPFYVKLRPKNGTRITERWRVERENTRRAHVTKRPNLKLSGKEAQASKSNPHFEFNSQERGIRWWKHVAEKGNENTGFSSLLLPSELSES